MASLTYSAFSRPIGDGTCGNLLDATTVVSSLGMCASYAWSNGQTGFCVVSGTQCFTSDDFLDAYSRSQSVSCGTADAMACYTFDQNQPPLRRSDKMQYANNRVTHSLKHQVRVFITSVHVCLHPMLVISIIILNQVLWNVCVCWHMHEPSPETESSWHSKRQVLFKDKGWHLCLFSMKLLLVYTTLTEKHCLSAQMDFSLQDFLAEHNAYRYELGRQAIRWDSALAKVSTRVSLRQTNHAFQMFHACGNHRVPSAFLPLVIHAFDCVYDKSQCLTCGFAGCSRQSQPPKLNMYTNFLHRMCRKYGICAIFSAIRR